MISVLMAYHRRARQLMNTLDSYSEFYRPDEIEICMVEDYPDIGEPLGERILRKYGFNYRYKLVDRRSKPWNNPAPLYNIAARMASGKTLALTNPENLHMGPVFTDAATRISDNVYLVYACASIDFTPESLTDCRKNWNRPEFMTKIGAGRDGWYVHSRHYPRPLHFMSIITKEAYNRINGFDEMYEDGYCYEDDDFAERVKANGLKIEFIDDPFVVHQFHQRNHHVTRCRDIDGLQRNRLLFEGKWKPRKPADTAKSVGEDGI